MERRKYLWSNLAIQVRQDWIAYLFMKSILYGS